ncbi:GNAT family N-acetyltransferase [Pseudonocardia sp. N23]|uniref:GNAT family N-acetyltransferase n=1 Tax=Pseudonocardia sp. N23 TaxID=1987376 RepID=UPI000BFC090C|nr:GNAT family protein [Pseudonocardia sp. N23]GAY12251.1 ribosomal-protein-S5p-alanine acetyltransferase [Pseudonocardia sp. N23]
MDVRVAAEVARFHLRPLRRAAGRAVRRESRSLWGATAGPMHLGGHAVLLRRPRLDDAEQWRAVRLREQARIERFWATAGTPWDARHSVESWVSTVLMMRGLARAGRALPFVAEVDGRFAGEVVFTAIDRGTGTTEAGVWFDPALLRTGVFELAPAMGFDHVADELGLRRITAPIATTNLAAGRAARRLGFRPEMRVPGYMDVGGERRDHDLYALTTDDRPEGGFAAAVLRRWTATTAVSSRRTVTAGG